MNRNAFLLLCLVFAVLFSEFFWLFYQTTGSVFADPELNDVGFHLARALNPWAVFDESYPMGFHVSVWLLSRLIPPVEFALGVFMSFLCFLLLPWAFYCLGEKLWGEEAGVFCGLFYLFSPVNWLFLGMGVYPQALALLFLVWGITAMIEDLREPSLRVKGRIALCALACGLVHRNAVLYYVLGAWFYLLIKGGKTAYYGFFLGLAFLFGLIPGFLSSHQVYDPGSKSLELFVIWLNPFNFILFIVYLSRREAWTEENGLLLLLIIAALGLSVFDPAFRPILYASALLCLFAGRALSGESVRDRLVLWFSYSAYWFIVFVITLLGISGLVVI